WDKPLASLNGRPRPQKNGRIGSLNGTFGVAQIPGLLHNQLMFGYGQIALRCCFGGFLFQCAASAPASTPDSAMARLQSEVHGKGWIAFGARSGAGDWDLLMSLPTAARTNRTP